MKLLGSAKEHALQAIYKICEYKAYCDLGRNARLDISLWEMMQELFVVASGIGCAIECYMNKKKRIVSFDMLRKSEVSPKQFCERSMDLVWAAMRKIENAKKKNSKKIAINCSFIN